MVGRQIKELFADGSLTVIRPNALTEWKPLKTPHDHRETVHEGRWVGLQFPTSYRHPT